MGTTLTTLHLYGADKAAVERLLAPGDLLREQNAPWLSVVPPYETEPYNAVSLGKLAGKLTKGNAAGALLFHYFDDDWFCCRYYREGRMRALCRSDGSMARLGRQLDGLFADDASSKALRWLSRCCDLEEQLRLMEETVGAALYDCQEEEARSVPRGDATLREIKAREAKLRKRPNQFVLTELERADWPEELQIRQALLELLRPSWREYELSTLLYDTNMKSRLVPGASGLAAYPYMDFKQQRDGLLLYDSRTGERREPGALPGCPKRALWQTRSGAIVLLFHADGWERYSPGGCFRSGGQGFVSCLGPDGEERWRFEPEMERPQKIQHAYSSPEGIVTIFATGNSYTGEDGWIWQIDGETGELLRSRRIPIEKEELSNLVYVKARDAFLYASRRQELILLDAALEETARMSGWRGSPYIFENQICEDLVYECFPRNGAFPLIDLRSGQRSERKLEIPAFAVSLLPDGRILGMNERQNSLIVFDREGTVTARCRVPGLISRVLTEEGRVCIAEIRGPDTGGLVYDALFDEMTTHVWRLDPAGQS